MKKDKLELRERIKRTMTIYKNHLSFAIRDKML